MILKKVLGQACHWVNSPNIRCYFDEHNNCDHYRRDQKTGKLVQEICVEEGVIFLEMQHDHSGSKGDK